MYDVRLRCSRALRGDAKLVRRDGGRRGLPMYDVRRKRLTPPMYDLEIRARCADFFRIINVR